MKTLHLALTIDYVEGQGWEASLENMIGGWEADTLTELLAAVAAELEHST